MKQEDLSGSVIDRFCYDTPTYPQEDFYALCDDDKPLVMVFLPNYGHPISRVYLTRYGETINKLQSGRLACVVHSDPQVIVKRLTSEYPFTLICDTDGILYDYFNIVSTPSKLSWSMEAIKIFHDAEKDGYRIEKGTTQQLPLTLLVGREGKILFSHYGKSLTDMPDDCEAIETFCARYLQEAAAAAAKAEKVKTSAAAPTEEEKTEPAAEGTLPAQDEPAEKIEPEAETEQLAAETPVLLPDDQAVKGTMIQNEAPEMQEPISADVPEKEGEPDETSEETDIDTVLEDVSDEDSPEEKAADEENADSSETPKSWNKLLGMFSEKE